MWWRLLENATRIYSQSFRAKDIRHRRRYQILERSWTRLFASTVFARWFSYVTIRKKVLLNYAYLHVFTSILEELQLTFQIRYFRPRPPDVEADQTRFVRCTMSTWGCG